MIQRCFAAAAVALAMGAASVSSAATVTLVYTGTATSVMSGIDYFGNAGGAVSEFTSTFVFDEGHGVGDLVGATIAQNGIVYDFFHDGHDPFGTDVIFHTWKRSVAVGYNGSGFDGQTAEYAQLSIALASELTPWSPLTPYDVDGVAAQPAHGPVNNFTVHYRPDAYHPGPAVLAHLILNPTHLTVTSVGPPNPNACCMSQGFVPEPGTWALMLLGFGSIGAVMRRRQVHA